MANYAVIKDGFVNNVIIAETKEIAEMVTGLTCIEYTNEDHIGIGWSYDGAEFTAPVVEEPTEETPAE